MTIDELKKAFNEKLPVVLHLPLSYGDMEYECIEGFAECISRRGERSLGVWLKCKCGHSHTLADPKDLRLRD